MCVVGGPPAGCFNKIDIDTNNSNTSMAEPHFSLSAKDREEFMERGFVHLRGVFSAETAEACRGEVWRLLGEQCGVTRDPASWCHTKVIRVQCMCMHSRLRGRGRHMHD